MRRNESGKVQAKTTQNALCGSVKIFWFAELCRRRRRLQDRATPVAAVCPAESQSTRRKATAAALRSIVGGYRATVGAAIDTDTIDSHRGGADGGEIAARRYD